jgi:hypothetical protein
MVPHAEEFAVIVKLWVPKVFGHLPGNIHGNVAVDVKGLVGKGCKKQHAEQGQDHIGVPEPKGFASLYHCFIVLLPFS